MRQEEQIGIVRRITGKEDFYEILGLQDDCSLADVEDAYKKLRKKLKKKASEVGVVKALEILENAFKCLRDKDMRKKYDEEKMIKSYEKKLAAYTIKFHLIVDPLLLLLFVYLMRQYPYYIQNRSKEIYSVESQVENKEFDFISKAPRDPVSLDSSEEIYSVENQVENKEFDFISKAPRDPVSLGEKNGDISQARENQCNQQLDVKKLFEEVMKCDSFDKFLLADVMDYFVENEKQAKLFLVKPNDLRNYWIEKFSASRERTVPTRR